MHIHRSHILVALVLLTLLKQTLQKLLQIKHSYELITLSYTCTKTFFQRLVILQIVHFLTYFPKNVSGDASRKMASSLNSLNTENGLVVYFSGGGELKLLNLQSIYFLLKSILSMEDNGHISKYPVQIQLIEIDFIDRRATLSSNR